MSVLTKVFVRANAFIFKISRGLLGSQMGTQQVLLLDTTGRKSGKPYHTPLAYYKDGNNYLIVASNWGQEALPDWFLNLRQKSKTTIQVKNLHIQVEATEAQGTDYERCWNIVSQQNSLYLGYQKKLKRQIPVVMLKPIS